MRALVEGELCTHSALVRMHFRGRFCIAFSMLLHRCVEPFASVLRSRCFACLCFKLPCALPLFGFGQLEHCFFFSFFSVLRFFFVFVLFQVQVLRCVDNALIKGEIESQWTGLIALLV